MDEAYLKPVTKPSAGRFFFPTLTPPFKNRATARYTLGRNAWALEQLLTFVNVTATIRTNVVQLQDGSLWVHSPQWPTGEFCELLDELGSVRHVVLPCNAFEHKAPMKAFVQKYPDASVWISPGQYSLFGSCGFDVAKAQMDYKVDGILTEGTTPPWRDEFDFSTLYLDLPENAGPVSETAFYHRPTKTLVATDAVVYVPQGPAPEIFETYFDKETVSDTAFWPKTVLQSVFLPLRQDSNGNYPGFEALKERLVRAPILRGFNDARAPEKTREWVEKISQWDFDRILTSHFASPIAASKQDFRDAFQYLQGQTDRLPPIACQDWELLDSLNEVIAKNKLGAPATFDYTKGCR